ncbi:MAG: DUF488 domain-containing protein [Chloroflexi bacterium]|nr:MAG: DUF488 domain-containing protein [Chloroflexota bacterium]
MTLKVMTIGVYGFDQDSFYRALQDAGVDVLIDIRQRRGMRGARYAFANSRRVQTRLAELGIRYLYRRDLAPTPSVRQHQKSADKASKTAKRQRSELAPAFIESFEREVLAHFEPQTLLDELEPDEQVIVLLCVEREPAACHRSLVAERLAQTLGLDVEHILPDR